MGSGLNFLTPVTLGLPSQGQENFLKKLIFIQPDQVKKYPGLPLIYCGSDVS